MKKTQIIYACTLLSGLLLLLASAYKALSLNNLVVAIHTGDINQFADSLVAAWVFSVVLLILVAIWILFLSAELRKFSRRAWYQGIIAGMGLALYGAGFWLQYPRSLHFCYFLLAGLLVLVPLLRYAGEYRKSKK
jgi:hypothetical protein